MSYDPLARLRGALAAIGACPTDLEYIAAIELYQVIDPDKALTLRMWLWSSLAAPWALVQGCHDPNPYQGKYVPSLDNKLDFYPWGEKKLPSADVQ